MHGLEVDVEMWEKEKEKIKKCLWWKDVVNGLTNQNQPTAEANTGNGNGGDTQTAQTDIPPPATLNQDGKAWYIHPISMINYFKSSLQIITYHIYHDGRIERHVPAELFPESEKRYEYIYHDKNNNLHNIGVFNYREVKNNYLDNKKRYGDMEYIHLINLNEIPQEYSKLGLTYRFNVDTDEQERFFMNRDTLASFLGALFEVCFNDISCNGFSTKNGTAGNSVSHFNGYHGDFKYLRTDKILLKGESSSIDIRNKDIVKIFDAERQNQ